MFTGIITDVGTVRAVEQRGDLRARIGCNYDVNFIDLGASIACDGVCLTVVDKADGWFDVDISAETLSKTNILNGNDVVFLNNITNFDMPFHQFSLSYAFAHIGQFNSMNTHYFASNVALSALPTRFGPGK